MNSSSEEKFDFDTALANLIMQNLTYEELLLKVVLMEQIGILALKHLENTKQDFGKQNFKAILMSMLEGYKLQKTLQGKAGAESRHKENNSIKAEAIKYYQENRSNFTNKDKAAEYISSNVVPAAFSTVRRYLRNK
jgi:hypothetical protein